MTIQPKLFSNSSFLSAILQDSFVGHKFFFGFKLDSLAKSSAGTRGGGKLHHALGLQLLIDNKKSSKKLNKLSNSCHIAWQMLLPANATGFVTVQDKITIHMKSTENSAKNINSFSNDSIFSLFKAGSQDRCDRFCSLSSLKSSSCSTTNNSFFLSCDLKRSLPDNNRISLLNNLFQTDKRRTQMLHQYGESCSRIKQNLFNFESIQKIVPSVKRSSNSLTLVLPGENLESQNFPIHDLVGELFGSSTLSCGNDDFPTSSFWQNLSSFHHSFDAPDSEDLDAFLQKSAGSDAKAGNEMSIEKNNSNAVSVSCDIETFQELRETELVTTETAEYNVRTGRADEKISAGNDEIDVINESKLHVSSQLLIDGSCCDLFDDLIDPCSDLKNRCSVSNTADKKNTVAVDTNYFTPKCFKRKSKLFSPALFLTSDKAASTPFSPNVILPSQNTFPDVNTSYTFEKIKRRKRSVAFQFQSELLQHSESRTSSNSRDDIVQCTTVFNGASKQHSSWNVNDCSCDMFSPQNNTEFQAQPTETDFVSSTPLTISSVSVKKSLDMFIPCGTQDSLFSSKSQEEQKSQSLFGDSAENLRHFADNFDKSIDISSDKENLFIQINSNSDKIYPSVKLISSFNRSCDLFDCSSELF